MRKVFPGTFQDVDFVFLKNQQLKTNKILLVHCVPDHDLLNMYLCHCFPDYYVFKIYRFHGFPVYYLLKMFLFHGFRVSQPCASVSQLPAALRRPQKKHVPGFWSMYLVDLDDGTAGNQLFHHQTMMEQRGNSCSITRQ